MRSDWEPGRDIERACPRITFIGGSWNHDKPDIFDRWLIHEGPSALGGWGVDHYPQSGREYLPSRGSLDRGTGEIGVITAAR